MAAETLTRYGWDEDWAASFAKISAPGPGSPPIRPGRVVRHHGVAVDVVAEDGVHPFRLRRGLAVAPVVGDWVAHRRQKLVAVLPRRSLLERRSTRREARHPLVANVDRVLITCGLDRPMNPRRIHRSATIAWDAGAVPTLVITKADLSPGPDRLADTVSEVARDHPGLDVVATSSVTETGLDRLSELIGDDTVALLGESGSGKSSLVNALAGAPVAATGAVRSGDGKGRHTTTARELYPLPGGGILVDTPGLRAVGLWADTDAVDATFDDITDLAADCRFRDCAHDREPGCAVRAAVDAGRLSAERLAAFSELEQEAEDTTRPPWAR